MRACWVNGVIDDDTLVWGQGLEAWYPVRNVIGLTTNIQSLDGAANAGESPLSPAALARHRGADARRMLPPRGGGGRVACSRGGGRRGSRKAWPSRACVRANPARAR
jgi:hypothetical protein